tara:strand:+ start:369 stop:665 length:297 start_codon:yes stop_codon:yes gene_type:complete
MSLSHCKNGMQVAQITEWNSQCQLFNFVVNEFDLPRNATVIREFMQRNGPEIQKLFYERARTASRAPEFKVCTVAEQASGELWEIDPTTPYNVNRRMR